MPSKTKSIAAIQYDPPAAVSEPLIEVIEPNFDADGVKGMVNNYAADPVTDPPRHVPYFANASDGLRFDPQGYGAVRHAFLLAPDSPANQWERVTENSNFERWTVPTIPDQYEYISSWLEGERQARKTTISGTPSACEFITTGATVTIGIKNLGTVGGRYRFTSDVQTLGQNVEIYVTVPGLGDLNGGAPVNATTGTIVEEFDAPVGVAPEIHLSARQFAAGGGSAVIDSFIVERLGAAGDYSVVRPMVSYNVAGSAVERPLVIAERWGYYVYKTGEQVAFSGIYATCTAGGRTATAPPPDWLPTPGTTIVDGACTWHVEGRYSPSALLVQPELIDVFGAGNSVHWLTGWTVAGGSLGGFTETSIFDDDDARASTFAPSSTATDWHLYRDVTIANVPTPSNTEWHTMLAIFYFGSTDVTQPDAVAVGLEIDGAEVFRAQIDAVGMDVVLPVIDTGVIEDADVYGPGYQIGPDTWAFWVGVKFDDGLWPAGATSARLTVYPANVGAQPANRGSCPQCVQWAAGVRGRYWPATRPDDVTPTRYPGDELQLRLNHEDRAANVPVNPRRGAAVIVAEPLRHERFNSSDTYTPAAMERLLALQLLGTDDAMMAIDAAGAVVAQQGEAAKYRATLDRDNAGPYSPPSVFVVNWDMVSNQLSVWGNWQQRAVAGVDQSGAMVIGLPDGFMQFDGDGFTVHLGVEIFRGWMIGHAALFSRPLTLAEIVEVLR